VPWQLSPEPAGNTYRISQTSGSRQSIFGGFHKEQNPETGLGKSRTWKQVLERAEPQTDRRERFMDVRGAVKDKANYAGIAAWFQSQGDLDVEKLELLEDTIEAMSEEIYEYHRALCDVMKGQLQRIRRLCRERGVQDVFPEEPMRVRILDVVTRACAQKAVLPEKYEELAKDIKESCV